MIYRIHAATDFEESIRSKFECLPVDEYDHPATCTTFALDFT